MGLYNISKEIADKVWEEPIFGKIVVYYKGGKYWAKKYSSYGRLEQMYSSASIDDVFNWIKGISGNHTVVVHDITGDQVDSSLIDDNKTYLFTEDGSFAKYQGYDYIIFKDGNTIKAKNARTGTIEKQGQYLPDVLEYTLENGDYVFIKSGTYLVDRTIQIPSNKQVEGAGMRNTILLATQDLSYIIQLQSTSYVTLKGLKINGTGYTFTAGIYVYGGVANKIENVQIVGVNGDSLSLKGPGTTFYGERIYIVGSTADETGTGIKIDNNYNGFMFKDCVVEQKVGNLIYISDKAYGVFINQWAEKGAYSVYAHVNAEGTIFINPVFSASTYEEIYIHPSAKNLIFINPYTYGTGGAVSLRNEGTNVWVIGGILDKGFANTGANFYYINQNNLNIPTSAPANALAGSMYFDTTTGTLYIYDGTTWKSVTLS